MSENVHKKTHIYLKRFLRQVGYLLISFLAVYLLYLFFNDLITESSVKRVGELENQEKSYYWVIFPLAISVILSMADKKSGVMAANLVSDFVSKFYGMIWNSVISAAFASPVLFCATLVLFIPILILSMIILIMVFFFAALEYFFELIYSLIMMIIELIKGDLSEHVTEITDKIPTIFAGIICALFILIILRGIAENISDSDKEDITTSIITYEA